MSRPSEGFRRRHLPSAVQHKSPPNVEVREAATQSQVKPGEAGDRVAKGISGNRSRTGVNAFTPGECALYLEAVTHALRQLRLKGIVVRVAFVKHPSNRTEVLVDGVGRGALARIGPVRIELIALWGKDISQCIHLRPDISERRLSSGKDKIGLIYAERLVYSPRAYIRNHTGQTGGKLLLHVQVPLHHVVALRVLHVG